MFNLTPKDFEEMRKETRLARLKHWREWLPTIMNDIKHTTGTLGALMADLARARDQTDPGRELLRLEPRISRLFEESYTMLGQIQGELAVQWLEAVDSTSISPA